MNLLEKISDLLLHTVGRFKMNKNTYLEY